MTRGRDRVRAALGWLVALACLAWIFHDVEPRAVWRSMTALDWWWVAPAIAADIFSYWCQGARWSLLLRPLGRVSALEATRAIYAGLFTNEVLPLRAGEVVRSWLVARRTGVPIARVVPSIAVERLFDGFWLTVAFALAAMAVRLPRNLARAADMTGGLVLAGAILVAIVAMREPRRGRAVEAPADGGNRNGALRRMTGRFLAEVREVARDPGFFRAGAVSTGVLVFQALAFWFVMLACRLHLSPWQSAIALVIVHLGTALPNAPGNVGSYQFFCVLGLSLFGVGKVDAVGFSIVAFVVLTAPLWALGFLALRGSGLDLGRVRREASTWLRR